MDEPRYSNRQIERMLELQTQDLKEHMEQLTAPILIQTTRTNGRVTKVEEDIITYKVWRGWMTGGMAMLMLVLPFLSGLMTYIFIHFYG